jgi:hypothetical protein
MPLSRYRAPRIARHVAFDHMNDCDLEIQSCGCDRSSCRCTRRRARLQTHTAAYSTAIDIADKIGRRKLAQREERRSDPATLKRKWLRRNRITTLLDPAPINKLQPASLFGEASLYAPYHRALSRLSSVTESIALPPRPKGGQDAKYQQTQYSRVAGASGLAAGPFCAADRRCDAYSVVVHLGGPSRPAQASKSFASSMADQLKTSGRWPPWMKLATCRREMGARRR